MFVDGDAFPETFAFTNIDFQKATNQQMIDLCHITLIFQAQVMDNRPIGGIFVMEVNLISCFLFTF